ncbi:hypothetical protein MRX96_053831 [Rhipicephalus microplus]
MRSGPAIVQEETQDCAAIWCLWPKPPIVTKKFSPATSASSDGVRHGEDSQPSTNTHRASSTSINETVHMPVEQCCLRKHPFVVPRRLQTSWMPSLALRTRM